MTEDPKKVEPPSELPLDLFAKLIGDGGLYDRREFMNFELTAIAKSIGLNGLRLDLDCPECNKPSTFVLPPVTAIEYENAHEPTAALMAACKLQRRSWR